MPPLSTRPFNAADYPRLTELNKQGHTVAALAKEFGYTRAQVQNALSRRGLRANPMRTVVNPGHALIADADTIRARFKASGLQVKAVAALVHVDYLHLNRMLRGAEPLYLPMRKRLARLFEIAAAKASS